MDTEILTLNAKEWADLPGTVPYSGSINGACITQNAVSIELEDITFEKSVQVKLFSDKTLLTTATLKKGFVDANKPQSFVTCKCNVLQLNEYGILRNTGPVDAATAICRCDSGQGADHDQSQHHCK